jgi:hypothetical protein
VNDASKLYVSPLGTHTLRISGCADFSAYNTEVCLAFVCLDKACTHCNGSLSQVDPTRVDLMLSGLSAFLQQG